jgi:type I restriction enzyme S subunit
MRNNTSWLQHIPKHWEIKRLKDVVSCNDDVLPENLNANSTIQYIEISDVDSNKGITNVSNISFGEAPSRARRITKKGDIVVSTVRTYLKAIATIHENDLIVSTGFAVLRPNHTIISRFLHYAILNEYVLDDIIKNSTGVSYPAIQSSKLIAMLLPLPPLSEQEKIARYLDTKVGEIDQKVSLIEKKIERYQLLKKSIINKVVTKGLHPEAPLKDSQISWLGQIPAHWEEKRLKDLGYFYGGLSGKSGEDFQNEDEDVIKPFIPYTNILNNFYVNPEVVKYVVINDNESQNTIQKGDLLFLMSSEDYESIAKASVVNEEVDELYLNSFCKGMRITNKQIYSPFLCYLLSNNDCRDSLRFEAQGFTRINIKTGKVACASIIIPPLSEQQEIASYLDQKCADIDAIIANCTAQIEKYKTLKRALINEVVTGQRTIE